MALITIPTPAGERHKSGHNLDVLFRYAKDGGGVTSVTVNCLNDPGRPGAYIVIGYRNGAVGTTYMHSSAHAMDLFQSYSALSNLRSWWAGCLVMGIRHGAGEWNYAKDTAK